MEDELKVEFGADVELKPSSGGAFEIVAGGNNIFSKLELKRFPEDGEIVGRIKEML